MQNIKLQNTLYSVDCKMLKQNVNLNIKHEIRLKALQYESIKNG